MKTGCSMDLSGIWRFEMAAKEDAGKLCETVKLPGSMDENGKGIDNTANVSPTYLNRDHIYSGPAVYQREIYIPAEWEGKSVILFLERTRKTRVWIDETPIGGGQQKSYTAPHVYDLTGFVQAGEEHTLTVEVDNSPKGLPEAMYTTFEKDFPWGHMVSEHTQTNWNGILGEMRLTAFPEVYIEDLQIRPDTDRKTACVRAKIRRGRSQVALDGVIELRASSYNNEKMSHAPAVQQFDFHMADGQEETELALDYQMGRGVLLWDEFSPTLYRMAAEVRWGRGGDAERFTAEESFGMRKFEALYLEDGGKQFAVNGRTVQLRGEISCAVFPMTGYAPMDLESWLKVMKTYKEYGFNHVRFHTWVPPKAAFRAADLLGLYVQFELPQWGHKMFGDIDKGDTSAADYYWEESLKIFDWVLNAPSAVMMALGNELRPGFYYYDEFLARLKQKELQLLYTDIAGWSAYTEHVDFSGSVPTYGEDFLHRVDPSTDWDHRDNVRKTPVPFLAHEAGQLQVYPDYEKDIEKYYAKHSLLKPRNLEHFRRILEKAGMGDMDKKFSRSSGELSAMLYRYMTESYLRTPGAGGFQLLGLQDFSGQGTALVGMVDAFMESKGHITPEEFRQSCSELAVLARIPKFVWKNDEVFTADIVISNYSAADLKTSVTWSLLDESGEKIAEGVTGMAEAPQGRVADAGAIRAELNGISHAKRLTLTLELAQVPDKGSAPYATGVNTYPVWVYPENAEEQAGTGETAVYRYAGADAVRDLEAGKKVLIISRGTKEALPKSRAVTFRPDFWSPMFHSADGDGYVLGCCIDADHPVFRDFPTGVFADWQWYDMTEGSRSILLDDAPDGLKPIVQAIPTIDLGERLGTLFEARAGSGRLMVCSLDLIGCSSPAAAQLLYSIKKYMDSDEFEPAAELELDFIQEILPETKDSMTVQAEGAQQDEVKEEGCAGSPADKTKFFEALERAGTLRQEDDMCGAWEKFRAVYQQAKSFGALTNAAQQETDEMTEKLLGAMAELTGVH